ncbi:MAG TPA: hypothetical protein VHA33_00010 [Candidatus Angelobacter sp.]|nr:hypothetical protein [Candidatus Angelobacter sp.]
MAGIYEYKSLGKAKAVVMFNGTTIENLLRTVERVELRALQMMWEEKQLEGNNYLVYRTNNHQMIEVA